MKILYQKDQTDIPVGSILETFWHFNPTTPDVREFSEELARGVEQHLAAIDHEIRKFAQHWKIDRMPVVDRNIVRLALYEFFHHPETPRAVVINEAIEIAKKFSSAESFQFVNGLLDGIRKTLERHPGNANVGSNS